MKSRRLFAITCLVPAVLVVTAFFVIPAVMLLFIGAGKGPDGEAGLWRYLAVLTTERYRSAMVSTVILSLLVTAVTLVIGGISGVFLARNRFAGRGILVACLTFPLAFPGVVVGFMVIMLAGRLGLIASISVALGGDRLVFAYSMAGLFLGYLYFSIPRVLLTVMGVAEKLDGRLIEAARSLGAGPWAVQRDIVLPALAPAFVAAGSICFATSMGAFGTAFTLATRIDVLPMVIYQEFTESANIAMAAALSVMLGLVAWLILALARLNGGSSVAAAG
ncbi:MAG: ABC transporter permease [Beijerinckiaceae bacterium]|jgi:putative spermidine/putrescine transport system permease protein|nr:ABC transporter permease [Beijerinckiaceae bacterium]